MAATSNYPGSLDAWPTNHLDDAGEIIHADTVNGIADAVNKIEAELGVNPSDGGGAAQSYSTVKARLATHSFGYALTSDQTLSAADTYISGVNIPITGRAQSASIVRWTLHATKTAAGVAAPIFSVRVGTAANTSDTARLVFTGSAQTAAVDSGRFELEIIFRQVGATAIISGTLHSPAHTAGLATGSALTTYQATSGNFDLTVANSYLGLSVNPGASGVWTATGATITCTNFLT